jgi:hypothetical protein
MNKRHCIWKTGERSVKDGSVDNLARCPDANDGTRREGSAFEAHRVQESDAYSSQEHEPMLSAQ